MTTLLFQDGSGQLLGQQGRAPEGDPGRPQRVHQLHGPLWRRLHARHRLWGLHRQDVVHQDGDDREPGHAQVINQETEPD